MKRLTESLRARLWGLVVRGISPGKAVRGLVVTVVGLREKAGTRTNTGC